MRWRGEYLGFQVTVKANSEKEAKAKVFDKVIEMIRNRYKNRVITVENINEYGND